MASRLNQSISLPTLREGWWAGLLLSSLTGGKYFTLLNFSLLSPPKLGVIWTSRLCFPLWEIYIAVLQPTTVGILKTTYKSSNKEKSKNSIWNRWYCNHYFLISIQSNLNFGDRFSLPYKLWVEKISTNCSTQTSKRSLGTGGAGLDIDNMFRYRENTS